MNSRATSQTIDSSSGGFALVITLIMVALLAIIAVGFFTTASLERTTAKSYDDRYEAELAAQSGLEAFKKTLVATSFPSPAPSPLPSPSPAPVTSLDTFLVVRADGGAPGASYYYLAQPSTGSAPTITYYPLFSSYDPSVAPTPTPPTQTINLSSASAPAVPTPAPPANSTASDSTSAWNTAKTQRLPTLYSWAQPSPSPSGPSVKWVVMHDPQETATAAPYNFPYTRYAYWAEDLDGYLDASQVGGQPRGSGTSPQEIAMWTVFNSTPQTDPGNTAATTLINDRPLLFTVPTVQQIAATSPDLAGPNLAVRLGMDNNPGEQNLVPLGYGYANEGQAKENLNALIYQLTTPGNGNQAGVIKTPLNAALPSFGNRSTGGSADYLSNLAANIAGYAWPQNAPYDFNPPGNVHNSSNATRGIGPYPFAVSLYDLNNWAWTYKVATGNPLGRTYHVVVEVTTYVQLWNPHNITVSGNLTIQYQNSDQVNLNGTLFTLGTSGTNITASPTSPITKTIAVTLQPNQYQVVVLP